MKSPLDKLLVALPFVLTLGVGNAHGEKGHHPHYPHLSGVKGIGVVQYKHGETHIGGGVGVFIERALIEDVIDVEVSVAYAHVGEEDIVPVDFLVKTPYFSTHEVTLFAGAGLSLTYEHTPQDNHLRPGVAAQAGAYFWAWEHYGIEVELDYNLLLTPELGHELIVATGLVRRF